VEIFEYTIYFRYEGYSSLSPEEDPGEGHEAHHHQGHDQEHRVAAHHARHILNSFQVKGSLTRDFRLQVFFVNQCPAGP
jgi:hypothetical protein